MKRSRTLLWAVVLYCLFDMLIGGMCGGLLPLASAQAVANPNYAANSAGRVMASEFAKWAFQSQNGISSGAQTVTLNGCYIKVGTANVLVYPVSTNTPLLITDGANTETVTPTAVTQPTIVTGPSTVSPYSCTFTATFASSHTSAGFYVSSGDGGLEEAVNYAFGVGGGVVSIDNTSGITQAQLQAAIPYQNVSLEDLRVSPPQFYNIGQTTASFLAAPATLTAVTALPSATPVGAYGTGTYHLAIAYVDAAGQVGPESADFSEAGLATGSFIFSAPAASTGAVGYVIYISLTSGTYSLDYEVPLSSSICTLTRVETTTPACAVANVNYNQSGSAATVTAITVNTSPVGMILGGVSGTLLTGNPNGRTTYGYVPSAKLSIGGLLPVSLAFTVNGIGSATPVAMGTVNIPAGVMNQVGREIRVCGRYSNTDVNSSTQIVNVYWDAAGSDVAGSPVKLGALTATGTGTAAVYSGTFCQNFKTTVSGAGATAGSMAPGIGFLAYSLSTSGNVVGNGADNCVTAGCGAVASLNLAGGGGFENRISIIHSNATGNATPTLQDLTIELVN